MSLVFKDSISLKNEATINEKLILEKISENPSVLGLGELTLCDKERIQPTGGRLDLLFSDGRDTRYEVELQLGKTDESHIIRTIEYWDIERKRCPKYKHCAVIIAAEIIGRFMNVISLFNGTIPLIAMKMSAVKHGDDILLSFVKILDRVELESDDDEKYEPATKEYWEKRCNSAMIKSVEDIFRDIGKCVKGFHLKYNKSYIGVEKDGIVKNFIAFDPHKKFLYLMIKGDEISEQIDSAENAGMEISYNYLWKRYEIKLSGYDDYLRYRDNIGILVKNAMEYYNIGE